MKNNLQITRRVYAPPHRKMHFLLQGTEILIIMYFIVKFLFTMLCPGTYLELNRGRERATLKRLMMHFNELNTSCAKQQIINMFR